VGNLRRITEGERAKQRMLQQGSLSARTCKHPDLEGKGEGASIIMGKGKTRFETVLENPLKCVRRSGTQASIVVACPGEGGVKYGRKSRNCIVN